jgi:cation transport ATPase
VKDVPVDETPKDEEGWRQWAAAETERARRESEAQVEQARLQGEAQTDWWRRRAAGQEQESLRQTNLMYGGLIGVGLIMVQAFLTAPTLDLSAKICVVAYSVAIPLLAALMMVNWQETYRQREAKSGLVQVARSVAYTAAYTGVVAGFWHMMPIAGIGVLVFSALGLAVHTSGFVRVEQDDAKTPPEAEGLPGQDDGRTSG